MAETTGRRVNIARQAFDLRHDGVEATMHGVLPEPIMSHFVVVNARRYPPKQVISRLTGLDRADFTTHQARRVLMRLGFPAGRRSSTARGVDAHESPVGSASRESHVEALRQLAGQWVATKDDDVLVAATSPAEVVGWLSQHGVRADSMFRVPEDESAASGVAP